MLITLALRNLLRNFRRTLLVEVAIIFGVIIIVFTGNFLHGMQRSWAQNEINANAGAFEIEDRDYIALRKAEPLKVTIQNSDQLMANILRIPGVRGAFGKLNFSGVVSNGSKSTLFTGIGLDVHEQKKTLPLQDNLVVSGRAISEKSGEIVLGSELAAMLELKIGDPVSIVVQTYYGSINLFYGVLVGTKNGRHFPASTYLEMNLAEAQKLLRIDQQVSQITVNTARYDEIDSVMHSTEQVLQKSTQALVLRGYAERIPIYATAIASFSVITIVVGIVLFLLVGGGIANVMAMAVMERRREIGTLRAIGMRQSQVRDLFLLEALLIGLIGATLGLILVSAISGLLASQGGLHLPAVGGTNQALIIVPQLDPLAYLFGLTMPIVVALFASWWPARRSARLHPIDALRF